MEEQKKMKATERLSLLEESMINIIETVNATTKRTGELELIIYNLSRESEILREALQLVHEKLDAVISLSGNDNYSDENISQSMIDAKVEGMAAKVKEQLDLGNLEVIEEIGEESFVVTRELNKDGTVENPRLQFLMAKLTPEMKAKFVGVKAGELVAGDDDKLDIEISEIYNFVEKEETAILHKEDGTKEEVPAKDFLPKERKKKTKAKE